MQEVWLQHVAQRACIQQMTGRGKRGMGWSILAAGASAPNQNALMY